MFYVFVDKIKSKWWLIDVLSCLHVYSYLVTSSNLTCATFVQLG